MITTEEGAHAHMHIAEYGTKDRRQMRNTGSKLETERTEFVEGAGRTRQSSRYRQTSRYGNENMIRKDCRRPPARGARANPDPTVDDGA
jgi:hypothetical protein